MAQHQHSPHQAAFQVAVRISRTLHKPGPAVPPIREMAQGQCRAVDVGEYRYITQNPSKASKWAAQARAGKQITWVIHQVAGGPGQFVAMVLDNQLRELKPR